MDDRTRLRINLVQREFEVEGSESFVREFVPRIESLLERFTAAPDPAAEPGPALFGGGGNGGGGGRGDEGSSSLGTFGEYLLRLPSSATDVDRMLAAGYFVQQHTPDDTFTTGDANKRLTEQGIKLGNPSQCVKQSVLAKRVFMVLRGRYRTSQIGRAHLRQLMGPIIPD